MVEDTRIFADVLEDIINGIDLTKLDNVDQLQFLYGHYHAIADELIEQTKSEDYREGKYPLIILGIDRDYKEVDINDMQYSVTANIWIVEETKKEWFTSERFASVFKTVLFPIYKSLEKAIFSSHMVHSRLSEIEPEVELIPYWGTQTVQGSDANIVNDPLDAIKFMVRDLIINKNCIL